MKTVKTERTTRSRFPQASALSAMLPRVSALSAILLLALGALSSCSKDNTQPSVEGRSGAICPTASVEAATESRAAVVGTTFPASTSDVFRLTAYAGAAAPTDWSVAPSFGDMQVNSGIGSALSLATEKFYPENGDQLYFYAYAPAATALTAGTATEAPVAGYTLTGQEDIMAAQDITGIAATTTGTQTQPALHFTHKLMQLRFKLVKGATFAAGIKVSEILIKRVRTSAKLDISSGALTFDGAADQTLSLPITAGVNDEITTAGTEMDNCVMCQPIGTSGTVLLRVTAGGIVYDDIEATLTGAGSGQAGVSHLITLTFKPSNITPSATITDWASPVNKDQDVTGDDLVTIPGVGDYYYTDGTFSTELVSGKTPTGLIFWVDPDDINKYKVMGPKDVWESWTVDYNYVVGVGAQSFSDGRANSAAIKAAWDARMAGIAIVESTFAEAFPLAASCYNYKGEAGTDPVGTWYVPARNELEYIWCAYNGAAPAIWETTSSVAVNSVAQRSWDARLQNVKANGSIDAGTCMSSTEDSSDGTDYWSLFFGDGSAATFYKDDGGPHSRCIREFPGPPAVGNYYYSDGTYSTALNAKKTPMGVVFWVDETVTAAPYHYKVAAMSDAMGSQFAWNPAYYVIGAITFSATDQSNIYVTSGRACYDKAVAYAAANGLTDFAATFPAFNACATYNSGDGTEKWYLPAVGELLWLYNAKAAITTSAPNGWTDLTDSYYWSGTETGSSDYAYGVAQDSGAVGVILKELIPYVRCVRDVQ